MKKMIRLLLILFCAFITVKASTFGWRFWNKSFTDLNKIDTKLTERLKKHVYKLAHEIGERSIFRYKELNKAEKYITEQFISFGYDVEFQEYNILDKETRNIIATKKGLHSPEKIIILGAHYDTCFNPGADDNASGVAALLELARLLSNRQTNHSIKFIAFVNEEPPFFKTDNMGSSVYAKAAKAKGENIKAVIVLETIGSYLNRPNSQRYPPFLGLFYPNKGNFITVVGNFTSRLLVSTIVSSFKRHTQFPIESLVGFGFIPGVDFSDHWSFWKEGYPAVMITDTAFYRNPNYHTALDTYDKLDYKSLSEVVKGFSEVLIEFTDAALPISSSHP